MGINKNSFTFHTHPRKFSLRTILNKSLLVCEIVLSVSDVEEKEDLQRKSDHFSLLIIENLGLKSYLI
jgi:hypothetical protein